MGRENLLLKSILPLAIALQTLSVQAADSNPVIASKHILPRAVQLQVTPRGMKYFDTKLTSILGNLGVNLDEGYFPAMSYSFDKEINPDDYATTDRETVELYKKVRNLLTNWLVGFSLNNHRPQIEIGDSGYMAQFSRFSLVTDEALMNALGKRDGAVLAIELEVKKITISTKSIIAWDLNNDFLGKVGMKDVTIQGASEKTPLKIRLPFFLRSNAMGGIDFEALPLTHNLDKFELAVKYKNLIVPTFAVEMNGKRFLLNTKQLDSTLNENMPMVLGKIREGLADFATQQMPAMLNQKAKEFLAGSLEQVQDMDPPGQEDGDQRPSFKWGLQLPLNAIKLKESLTISLNAYVEDTLNSKSTPVKNAASRGAPALGALPTDKYDLAMSLDRSLINRILQLSYERKNFDKIPQSDGSSLKLRAAPTVDFIKAPAGVAVKDTETFLKLHVAVEDVPESFFLKETIVVEFDIIAKLRQLPDKSGMQLVLHKIDHNSMTLDHRYFSFAGMFFKSRVMDGVREELELRGSSWAAEEAIDGSLPLPPEILGINLDIAKVVMDPNGHIVMYLNYAKSGVK